MSTRYWESDGNDSLKRADYLKLDFVTLSEFHGSFTATKVELTEEEREQIKQSRENIASGHSQRFRNVEEYLNSLNEDTD